MPPWRGVLFDLDGVLIDSEVAYRDAFADALAAFGMTFDPAAYGALIGLATPLRAPILRAMFGDTVPVAAFAAAYQSRKRAALATVRPMPDAPSAVRAARARGLAVAVATSASAATAATLLRTFPLTFDAVVTRDDVRAAKPSAWIHQRAAALIGCDPAACLAIEDSRTGLLAARAARCVAVLLPDPRMPPDPGTSALADTTLPTLRALGAFLDAATTAVASRSAAMAPVA